MMSMKKLHWFAFLLIILYPLQSASAALQQRGSARQLRDETTQQFLELVGHAGGPSNGIAVQNGYAFIGLGPELAVLDISDPHNPRRIGYSLLYDDVKDIAVSGQYAYAAGSGLYIVDISSPERPVLRGSLPYEPAKRVKVQGQHALLMGSDFLLVVQIDPPGKPQSRGVLWSEMETSFTDLAIAGDFAFLTWSRCDRSECTGGITAVNLSNPQQLTVASTLSFAEQATSGIMIYGDYAYVQSAGLHAISIQDPYNLNVTGYCQDCTAGEVLENQGHIYLVGEQLVDITLPSQPQKLSTCEVCQGSGEVSGIYAYFAPGFTGLDQGGVGLQVVDLTNPADPEPAGAYRTFAAEGLTIAGKRAYLIQAGRLGVVDLSRPHNPQVTSFTLPLPGATAIEVAKNYAYVSGLDGLAIVNISNPYAPYQVSLFPTPADGFQDLEINGTLAYLAGLADGILILDISTPSAPRLVEQIPVAGTAEGLAFHRDENSQREFIYLTGGSAGAFSVFDVTDPAAPFLLGTCAECSGERVVYSGGLAYVTAWEKGLKIVDVSDPTHPFVKGIFEAEAGFLDIAIQCNTAYLSAPWSGLYVVDVHDPAHPELAGVYKSNSYPFGVRTADGYVYSVNYVTGGLFVLRPAIRAVWSPDEPFQLSYLDARCWRTTIYGEPGALDREMEVTLAAPALYPPQVDEMYDVRFTFDVSLADADFTYPGITFSAPVTVTVQYPAEQTGAFADVGQLAVYQNREDWQTANTPCSNAIVPDYDTLSQIFSFQICRSGSYALLGPGYKIALPLLVK